MKIKRAQYQYIWLGIIVLAGFIFRLAFINSFSLSNDELSAVHRLDFNNITDLINEGIKPDGHPAGAQILLYFWTKFFGISHFQIRFPFLLISSLAPFFAFLFLKDKGKETSALIFALFISLAEFPILYGLLARPYGTGLTFILASAWLWKKVLFDTNARNSIWIISGLAISWCLSAYFHYFSALTALTIALSGLFFLNRKNAKPYLISSLLAILLFIPHLKITFVQLAHKGVGSWLAKPEPLWIFDHLFFVFNESFILIFSFFALIFYLSIYSSKIEILTKKQSIAYFFWFSIPFITGYYYSIKVDAVLQNSVLIFSSFFLIAAILNLISKNLDKNSFASTSLFGLLLVSEIFIFSPFKPQNSFADFESTAKIMKKWQDVFPDIHYFVQTNHLSYLFFYKPELRNLDSMTDFKKQTDLPILIEKLDSANDGYIGFVNLKNEANPLVYDIMRSKYGKPVQSIKFDNLAEAYLFKKSNYRTAISYDSTTFTNNEFSGNFSGIINPTDDSIFINALYILKNPPINGHLVVSIEDEKGNTIHWESAPFLYFIDNYAPSFSKINIHRNIKITKNAGKFKMYLWNPDKESFYLIKSGFEVSVKQ